MGHQVYVDGQLGSPFQTREDAEDAAQGFRAQGFDAYVVGADPAAGGVIDLDHDLLPLPRLTDGRSDRERELGAELVRRREAGERDGDLPRLLAEAEAAREAGEGGGG